MVKPVKQEYPQHPFLLAVDHIAKLLETNIETGSSKGNAGVLSTKYGENKLEGEGGVEWHSVLLRQISNAMILVHTSRVSFPQTSTESFLDSQNGTQNISS